MGTAALQSLLESFKVTSGAVRPNVLKIVADSFPTAGPFYVGWCMWSSLFFVLLEIRELTLIIGFYSDTYNCFAWRF